MPSDDESIIKQSDEKVNKKYRQRKIGRRKCI